MPMAAAMPVMPGLNLAYGMGAVMGVPQPSAPPFLPPPPPRPPMPLLGGMNGPTLGATDQMKLAQHQAQQQQMMLMQQQFAMEQQLAMEAAVGRRGGAMPGVVPPQGGFVSGETMMAAEQKRQVMEQTKKFEVMRSGRGGGVHVQHSGHGRGARGGRGPSFADGWPPGRTSQGTLGEGGRAVHLTGEEKAPEASPVEGNIDPEAKAKREREERERKLAAIRAARQEQAAKNRELAEQRKRKIDEINAAARASEELWKKRAETRTSLLEAKKRRESEDGMSLAAKLLAEKEMQLEALRKQLDEARKAAGGAIESGDEAPDSHSGPDDHGTKQVGSPEGVDLRGDKASDELERAPLSDGDENRPSAMEAT